MGILYFVFSSFVSVGCFKVTLGFWSLNKSVLELENFCKSMASKG